MTRMRPSGGRRTPSKRNSPFWAIPGLLAAIFSLLSCTEKGPTTVAGSEIGNPTVAVSGIALYPDGRTAGGASVLLRRQDFLAEDKGTKLLSSMARLGQAKVSVSLANVFTDSQGRFRIDSVDAGDYRIEINDGQSQGLVLDFPVTVKTHKDTVVHPDSLRANGTVYGMVEWDAPPLTPFVALAYGMDRVAIVDQVTGKFTIDQLPPGTYTFKVGCLSRGCLSKDVENVHVAAGESVNLPVVTLSSFATEDYSKWTDSAKVTVNTSASGAAVSETLANFPLLVRLDSSNFDFSKADGRGRDIRFASLSGRHLHFDIERWDSLVRKAEIWVQVDSIYGDNGAQSLKMLWGNQAAAYYTGSTQVFGAQAGYRGVWHLAEEGSSTANGFRDASGHANHGTGIGIGPVASREAVAGQGLSFDGNTSVEVKADSSLHTKDSLTLEVWINASEWGVEKNKFKRIVSKAFAASGYPWTEYDIETDSTGTKVAFSITLGGTLRTVISSTQTELGYWYHVVGTYDGENLSIYVNGAQETSQLRPGVITDYGRGLTFGRYDFDNASNYHGKIDEVRVSSRARSAGWIKLSYENQKQGSKVVSIVP
ncbi:MAG: putative protein of unknown function acetylesterase [Fibrobacteres bacterium]|nr:putative protein of unknown function acetylesterase [Fibrobacterota bacterium]